MIVVAGYPRSGNVWMARLLGDVLDRRVVGIGGGDGTLAAEGKDRPLNGQVMQNSNTSQMIFKIPYLISFISKHITLSPGDVILTGTPSGVGRFRKPRVLLKDDDEVTVEIEGLGKLTNRCRTISLNAEN